jgi:hypothetical protein
MNESVPSRQHRDGIGALLARIANNRSVMQNLREELLCAL